MSVMEMTTQTPPASQAAAPQLIPRSGFVAGDIMCGWDSAAGRQALAMAGAGPDIQIFKKFCVSITTGDPFQQLG